VTTQDQIDRSRRVDVDSDKNGLLSIIITCRKFHPYIQKKEATIAGTIKTTTNSFRVRGKVAQAVAPKLGYDTASPLGYQCRGARLSQRSDEDR
jgi:hypothetical protein